MADENMLQLPLVSAVDGSEFAWIVQGGTDKRCTVADIANTATGLLPPGGLAGQVLIKQSDTNYDTKWFTATGIGTVTSVALSLPAIFAVSGSPVTAAGTLTGTLATQTANIVWAGPSTGADAAPTFRALVNADLPTVDAAHGGTGNTSYTIGDLLYASGAAALSKLADVATGNVLLSGGVGVAPSWGKVDVTAAITGILPLANGGTNANLTASNGGIFYSTATAGAILSGTATARQMLQSGSSAAPAWSTAVFPATTAAGTILASATANTVTATATPTLGVAGSVLGTLALAGNTSGTATITPQAIAGTPTLTLPNASGTFGVSATAPLALSATTGNISITGAAGMVLAGATPAFTATPVLGIAGSTVGTLGFQNATSGTITLSPVAGALGTVTLTLPAATDTIAVLAAAQALTNKTYNGLTISSTTGTLTVTNAKTLSISNTLTLAGSDGTTMTFPATSSTVLTTGNTATITKGFTVTPNNLGNITSFTIDPTLGNVQYGTNHGAATWTAPASDCEVDILVTNDATAGSITFSGFTVGAATGSALTTTNTSKFIISIKRINSVSSYSVYALQ